VNSKRLLLWLAGGVHAVNLHGVTLQLDGTLRFLPGRKEWPTQQCAEGGNPLQPKRNGICVQEAIFIAVSASAGRCSGRKLLVKCLGSAPGGNVPSSPGKRS